MQTSTNPPISINIHPIGTQKQSIGFEVSGEIEFGQGQLLISNDKQAAVATPVHVQVSSAPFSFWHPGVATPGTYTVLVSINGVSARSAPYTVVAPTPVPTPPPVVTPPPPVVTPVPPALVVLTPTSGGTIKDASGNVWALGADKSVYENNVAVPGGGGTSKLTIVNNVAYAQDATTGKWYTYNATSKAWSPTAAPTGV